jgi:hypothetical protein
MTPVDPEPHTRDIGFLSRAFRFFGVTSGQRTFRSVRWAIVMLVLGLAMVAVSAFSWSWDFSLLAGLGFTWLGLDDLLTRRGAWGAVAALQIVGLLGFPVVFVALLWTVEGGIGRSVFGLAVGLAVGAFVYMIVKVARR